MSIRELKRAAQEKHGYPHTVKFRGSDQGYDPFTGDAWKPKRSTRHRLRITVTSWTHREWRGKTR